MSEVQNKSVPVDMKDLKISEFESAISFQKNNEVKSALKAFCTAFITELPETSMIDLVIAPYAVDGPVSDLLSPSVFYEHVESIIGITFRDEQIFLIPAVRKSMFQNTQAHNTCIMLAVMNYGSFVYSSMIDPVMTTPYAIMAANDLINPHKAPLVNKHALMNILENNTNE